MRFIEVPALSTEDIETPDIVDITEPITASISGTTLEIDGGSKVSGEATITLTNDVTVSTVTTSNIRQPSIHKITIKTNGAGNFTYVPNDTVTASSLSTTTKTGSDFEILLISTTGGETYVDFDMADYVSPAANFSNVLTGFDISEITSAYGATAKLYKPGETLPLTTVSSATSGSSVNFNYSETDPQDVTYTLEVTDDLGRTSRYDLPRKWISYAMGTGTTPGFQKFKLEGIVNEYTTTVMFPSLGSSSKARIHKTTDHGYMGIKFKIQGRNSTNDAWVDIANADEDDEVLAFGNFLYHRVWVKPTAKATTTVSSSNVVTLTLSDFTEETPTTSFTGADPFDINESTNTYVFEETTKIGTVPFTVTLDTETYTNAVTATTEGTAYDYVTLAFTNPTLSLTTSNVTISSAKLYKDDVLFHTYGTESNVVLRSDQTGTYQAIVNDVYYSNRVTPDFTTTRSVSAPQLEFDGYNRLNLSNITPTSSTLGLPDGTTRDLTTQSNVYIYETGTYTANVQSSDTFAYLSNVVTSQPSQHPTDVGPTLTFDGFNKLAISNITQTSASLRLDSKTYDTNTASNVYVTDAGEYKLEARDANTFVMSNVYVGALDTQVDYTNLTSMYYGGAVTDVNGVLYTWGHDGYGDSGRGASDRIPTAITSISDPVSNVWRGTPGYTVAAKTSTDKWYMWGRNTYSAVLGNTTNTGNVTTPEDVTAKVTEYFGDQTVSANKIIKMAMGEHHAAALTAGGKVWSWGNDFGYYSTGTGTNNSTVLVTPVLLTTVPMPPTSGQTGYLITNTNSAVSTLKIRANGSTFTFNSQTCWYYDRLAGSNNTWYTQQLGYVPSTNTFIEASISGNPDQVYHNKTSYNVTKGSITVPPEGILLSNDPSSWNGAALFANPFTSTQDSGHLTGIIEIQATYRGMSALDSSGNVWFWGGASTSMQYAYPTKLLDSTSISGIVGLRATNAGTLFAWKSDGTFYTRGKGNYGQLANGSESDQYASWQTVTTLQGKTIKKVFGGNENMFVWANDGVYGVGRGNNYKLGNGSTSNRSTFHKSNTISALSIREIDFGHATGLVLTTDGRGYMWGEDSSNSMANALSGHQSGAAEATSISALSFSLPLLPTLNFDGYNKLTIDNVSLSPDSFPNIIYFTGGYWGTSNPIHRYQLDTSQTPIDGSAYYYELWQGTNTSNQADNLGSSFHKLSDGTTEFRCNEGDNTHLPPHFKWREVAGTGSWESNLTTKVISVGNELELYGDSTNPNTATFTITDSMIFKPPSPDTSVTIKKDGATFATTTSNTVYIREEGTYTAEVKGSDAYVTELSKVVSGDVTNNPSSNFMKTLRVEGDHDGHNESRHIDMCDDGSRLVWCSPMKGYNNSSGSSIKGVMYIYKNTGGVWSLEYTDESSSYHNFGRVPTFNSAGTSLFVVEYYNDSPGSGAFDGRIRVYDYNSSSSSWSNTSTVNGSQGEALGMQSISCNDAGTVFAVSRNAGQALAGGYKIYSRPSTSSTSWTNDVNRGHSYDVTNKQFGISLSMDGSGTRLLIGGFYGKIHESSYNSGTWSTPTQVLSKTANFGYEIEIARGLNTRAAIRGRNIANGDDGIYDRDGSGNWTQTYAFDSVSSNSESKVMRMNRSGTRVILGYASYNSNQGQVLIYDLLDGTWSRTQTIIYDGSTSSSGFGAGVAMARTDGNTIGIATPYDDGAGTDYGAFYVYDNVSGYLTYDNYNKITLNQLNYADTTNVTYYSNTYELGTAKTMYVKDAGEYVFRISGTDKYVESNVYVSSVDLAGASTKPIDFDGYNKLTLIDAGSNVSANVTYFSNTYELGSANVLYINGAGTYGLEMSGSNVFALSSNVVDAISTPPPVYTNISFSSAVGFAGHEYRVNPSTLQTTGFVQYQLYHVATSAFGSAGHDIKVQLSDNTWSDADSGTHPDTITDNGTTVTGTRTDNTHQNPLFVFTKPSNVIQQNPSLTFDNYNKLTLENFTTSESDTRTAKLTDPNDVEYTLGQTQNDIYIEETGDYFLEVTNSDQSAVVKKTIGVGSINNNVPESTITYPVYKATSDTQPSSYYTAAASQNKRYNDGVVTMDFFNFYNGALSTQWLLFDGSTTTSENYNLKGLFTFQWNNNVVKKVTKMRIFGRAESNCGNSFKTEIKATSSDSWTTLNTYDRTTDYTNNAWNEFPINQEVNACRLDFQGFGGGDGVGPNGYWHMVREFEVVAIDDSVPPPPSLTFDNYNKLSINNLTPTSSRLTYGSNTYEIGTASNVYIEHGGTYKMATGDANTFALVSNVVGTTPAPKQDYTNIWAGEYGGMVVDSDGKLYTWGNDGNNQSGRGASDRTPTHISTISDPVSNVWVEGAPGRTRIVKTSTDKWYMWGMNLDKYKIFGQTGDQTAPVDVTSDFTTYFGAQGTSDTTRIIKVVTSASACSALAADGKVWSWGVDGNRNELGKNTTNGTTATPFKNTVPTIPSTTPTVVSPLPVVAGSGDQGFTMVYYQTVGTKFYYKSDSHSGTGTAISYDYSTQTWGDEGVQVPFHFNTTSTFASTTSLVNPAEIHGFGSQQNHSGALYFSVSNPYYEAPTELSNITDIRCLLYGKLALDSNGDVWQWGQIGTGSTGYPTKQTGLDSITIIGIGAGYFTAYAWDAAGTIYSIGQGTEGQLGNGSSSDQHSTWQTVTTLQGKTIYGIYGAGYSVFAHTSDGVYACGQGTNGRLGMGNNNDLNVFTKSTALSALSIYKLDFGHGPGYIITTDGKGYALGYDYLNSIPTPLSGDKNVPTEASSLTNLSLVYQPPAITYDTSNKLSITGITPTSTTLTDPNGSSLDIGTASNVYIRDSGKYAIASKDANTFVLTSNTVTGTPTGTTYVYDSNTFTTPSQVYDNTKTITVSNVPSTLPNVVGKIYKGSTAYTIHATEPTSNVIIKNTGTYLSVFTTATQAFLTNAVNVNATPESDDTTIEDEASLVTVSASTIVAFHYGDFVSGEYGYTDVATASAAGFVFANTSLDTYEWGTLNSKNTGTPEQTGYSWTPASTLTAYVLMVAGGGGGGGTDAGGGGAGGLIYNEGVNISGQQTIVIGSGGIGGLGWPNTPGNGAKGTNTTFMELTAYGGGGGGNNGANFGDSQANRNGGSGGGDDGVSSTTYTGGTAVSGQGFPGGLGISANPYSGGGGGGAGGAGGAGTSTRGGNGGIGKFFGKGSSFTEFGDVYGDGGWFASGGGGGSRSSNAGTPGTASDGGGTDGTATSTYAVDAKKHTGGGGGGASHDGSTTNRIGADGGSGIVIIKYVATTTTGGLAGSTAVPSETVVDTPSATLDATDTTVTEPTLNLDFTTTLPKTLKRYNGVSNSSIGARFNRRETKKKRIEKSISIPSSFSAELTANNASSPTTLTVTVANSKFVINSDETPTLGFIRGETYTFDQSDASNSGHPLVLATSADGATQYTTGWVNNVFTVPYDVPDTIYYKCSNDNNMGGEIHTTFGNAFSLGDFTVAANTHVSGEYTLAVNYNGTTSNLYVNGSLITQTTPTISAGTKDFILGKEFDGYVKNFTFWNYAKRFFVAITGVLDLYSLYNDTDKIASAYGFRLLFKEYEGAHAKIKRSSDNAELDVTFEMNGDIKTPTNFTTWKGSDTLYVTKWYDQSGRGLDVVPINSSTPPVFDNAQSGGHFSGKWGATFNSSNDQELKIDNYTNSFGTGTQKYTIFCSTYWDGGTSSDTLFAIGRPDSARNVAFHPNNGGGYNHYHYGNDVTRTGISDQTSLTIGLRYTGGASNSTNMKQWFDTTLQSGSGSSGSSLNLESGQPLRIGGYSIRGSGHYYEGRIFNFIVLRTDRTDSEVTDIASKLNTY